jgi:hypothetical protein
MTYFKLDKTNFTKNLEEVFEVLMFYESAFLTIRIVFFLVVVFSGKLYISG